ncbi:hypothetical protein RhiirA4_467910 [Rhizophagus irregularis]|uniref:Uncharacterized protein n=1 Tax=Rhizophagus irregularis TaxID=588596 RepID=A0A2I1GWT2_9GLOM|nr:hypothetical protein RhiirA4_467910 [Rhizophagus irregularis]
MTTIFVSRFSLYPKRQWFHLWMFLLLNHHHPPALIFTGSNSPVEDSSKLVDIDIPADLLPDGPLYSTDTKLRLNKKKNEGRIPLKVGSQKWFKELIKIKQAHDHKIDKEKQLREDTEEATFLGTSLSRLEHPRIPSTLAKLDREFTNFQLSYSKVTTPSSHQYSRKGWTSDETKALELRPHKRRVNTGNFSGSFELQHTDKKLRPMVKSDTGYDAPGPSTH